MKKLILLLSLIAICTLAFADTYIIGTGTSTTYYCPFNGLWDYSWSKAIWTAAELTAAGLPADTPIIGIGFYVGNTPSNYTMLDQRIYVRTTTLTSYSTATDETGTGYPNPAYFLNLFQGDLTYNGSGWHYITFETPVSWDGTSNLELLFENWDGDYVTGYPTFCYTSTSPDYRTVYKSQDNSFPAVAGTRSYNRPNVAIITPSTTPPEAPVLSLPLDGATDVNEYTTFTWTAPQTGSLPTGYKLYCDTNNPPTTLIVDQSALSYTLTTPLAYNTTYYWTVSAYNAIGEGPQATVRSFTTREDPTIYTFPWLEDFGTTGTIFPPNNWSKLKYLYGGTPASGGSWAQDDWLNTATGNKAARLNIYGTTKYDWLITPPIQIPDTGYELKFDLALMDYGNNDPVIVGGQPDDRFIVAISNNPDMTSSTILREWNNTGSTFVYDNIPNTGTTCVIDLSDYVGTKYIAFYGESTLSNGDNDLMVDNFTIRQVPTGPVLYYTPTSLDFGEVAFGVQVGPKKVTVTNTGTGVLALNKADNTQIIGTGFAIDDFDFSLEANESGQINVYANATQEGPFTATLRITYGTQQCNVSLSATGLPEGIIVIGTGTEELGLPIDPYYRYSYSQSIFLQSEINKANRYIEKIYYYWNGAGAATNSNVWTIYLGHTDINEFANANAWIPITDFSVYNVTLDLSAGEGWVEINLDTPFYHTDQNLVIAVDENIYGYDSYPNVYFYCTSVETKGNRSISYADDSTNPDPTAPPAGTLVTGYPNIKLEFEEAQPPLPVELTSFTVIVSSENMVQISWVTQTETEMLGYYIYRSTSETLDDNALLVSDMIEALNTAEQHTYTFTDSEIVDSGTYYYWLQTVDLGGTCNFHGPVSVVYTNAADNPIPEIPKVTELRSIYPNPFNPVAFIPYSLAEESDAHFYIYNVKGQLLRHIYVGPQYPGYYQIRWDGKDINGKSCGSGVYYIIMKAGKQTFQRKAVLMK